MTAQLIGILGYFHLFIPSMYARIQFHSMPENKVNKRNHIVRLMEFFLFQIFFSSFVKQSSLNGRLRETAVASVSDGYFMFAKSCQIYPDK